MVGLGTSTDPLPDFRPGLNLLCSRLVLQTRLAFRSLKTKCGRDERSIRVDSSRTSTRYRHSIRFGNSQVSKLPISNLLLNNSRDWKGHMEGWKVELY
jgi:hypothetical protein